MYDKNLITKFIEKYYLNGLINGAQLTSEKGDLHTVFRNSDGNVRGEIKLEKINLPDGIIGVYYTSNLLKMMSILHDEVTVEYKGARSEDKSVIALEFRDKKGRKATHATSMLELIDYDGKKGVVKDYDVKIKLDNETIQDLLKAFSAINTSMDSQTMTILKKDDKLYAVFGYSGSNVDQIEIELNADVDDDYDEIISFPGNAVKEILSVNGKSFQEASMNISVKGLMQFKFEELGLTAEYWLRKNN
jgi:hypothetical protein